MFDYKPHFLWITSISSNITDNNKKTQVIFSPVMPEISSYSGSSSRIIPYICLDNVNNSFSAQSFGKYKTSQGSYDSNTETYLYYVTQTKIRVTGNTVQWYNESEAVFNTSSSTYWYFAITYPY